jgi:hypothetical protein
MSRCGEHDQQQADNERDDAENPEDLDSQEEPEQEHSQAEDSKRHKTIFPSSAMTLFIPWQFWQILPSDGGLLPPSHAGQFIIIG